MHKISQFPFNSTNAPLQIAFKSFQPLSFFELVSKKPELNEETLVQYYYSDHLKNCFHQFIKILEPKLQDPLPFVRKNILQLFLELFEKCPESEKEVLGFDILYGFYYFLFIFLLFFIIFYYFILIFAFNCLFFYTNECIYFYFIYFYWAFFLWGFLVNL